MNEEFVMRFFDVGAIDLNSDDNKLGKLRETVKDLSAALAKAPAKTASFTLVAADPNIAATDPVIQEAMTALRKRWETISNTFSAAPIAILRAILLDAVMQVARTDNAVGVAFVNSARNALAHTETSDEDPIWRDAVQEIESKVDAVAEAEWATPDTITIGALNYKAPSAVQAKFEAPTVDAEKLQLDIFSSLGPYAGVDHNRYHHHSQHQPQAWAQEASHRLSAAFAGAIDGIAEALAPAPVDLAGPLKTLAEAVSKHVENALASFSGATAGLQRRTNLLWWKEALYSPSAHASYRDMPSFEAAALMALDLHALIPTYSPASVSAFLKEAIGLLPIADDLMEGRSLESLVDEARTAEYTKPLRTFAADHLPAPNGRGPLLALIGHATSAPNLEPTILQALGGIDPAKKFFAAEWGTHIFRELQAARAINGHKMARKK